LLTLLLYYFVRSDGVPEAEEWISFAELPNGRFYNQAYQGYTGRELAKTFKDDLKRFTQAAENVGGRRKTFGDAAYSFQVLPLVSLLVVYWKGDEDFPSSVQILFDISTTHHLPTDVCAILGATLTRRLITASSEITEISP
jgi:hypothetical protein